MPKMPKPKQKVVLFHKPTQSYAARNSGKYQHHGTPRKPNPEPIEAHLTPHLSDCRIFTMKSTAANAYIYQMNKDDFEILPIKITLM